MNKVSKTEYPSISILNVFFIIFRLLVLKLYWLFPEVVLSRHSKVLDRMIELIIQLTTILTCHPEGHQKFSKVHWIANLYCQVWETSIHKVINAKQYDTGLIVVVIKQILNFLCRFEVYRCSTKSTDDCNLEEGRYWIRVQLRRRKRFSTWW